MIYLDYAATSFPKPDAVVRAVANTMHYCGANPGRSGHRLSIAAGSLVMQAREALAQYLNAPDPFQIIFCLNCTDALNTACLLYTSYRFANSTAISRVRRVWAKRWGLSIAFNRAVQASKSIVLFPSSVSL